MILHNLYCTLIARVSFGEKLILGFQFTILFSHEYDIILPYEACLNTQLVSNFIFIKIANKKKFVHAGGSLLNFTTLWGNSADGKVMIFFLFFPENRI